MSHVFATPPTLIGHRGLGKGSVEGHNENTLSSFLTALERGAEWLEVDVRRTADDDLFVWHDPAFPDGVFLADIDGDEAAKRQAPRLVELLDMLPSDTGVIFDVKSSMEDAARSPSRTTAALFATIGQQEARRRPTAAMSFDPAALRHMRERAPDLPLGLLTWHQFPTEHAVAAVAHMDVQLLGLHDGSLRPNRSATPAHLRPLEATVTRIHDANRQVVVWCPSSRHLRRLVLAGVDAMIIDNVPRGTAAFASARRALASLGTG